MATTKVVNWIKKMLAFDNEGETVDRLILRHLTATVQGTGADVHTVRLPPKSAPGLDESHVSAWADELEHAAQDDAEGLQGATQSYIIFAFSKLDRDRRRPVSRCPLRVAQGDGAGVGAGSALALSGGRAGELAGMAGGGGGGGAYGYDSEPPTQAGITSMLMRHTEGATRIALAGMQQIVQTLTRENARLTSAVEQAFDRQIELIAAHESIVSEKAKREQEIFAATASESRKNEMFTKLMLLAPNIINRVMGKKAIPESTTPLQELVTELGASFTDDQSAKLMTILTPDQIMAFGTIMQEVAKRKEEEQEKIKKRMDETRRATDAAAGVAASVGASAGKNGASS